MALVPDFDDEIREVKATVGAMLIAETFHMVREALTDKGD